MRLLAALSAAAFAYLAIGAIVGRLPHRPTRRPTTGPGRSERLAVWLRQADAHLTPGQFVAASVGGALATGTVVFAVAKALPVALVPALAAGLAPRWYFARQRERLQRARLLGWPDALRDLLAHLDSAMSLHRALVELGRTGPQPLRATFTRYATLAAAVDARPALEAVREELADPVSDRIIAVLVAALDQGTRAVRDIIVALAEASTEDVRLQDEIRTRQLEHRIEAAASVVMPFVVLTLLCVGSQPFRSFYATPAGFAVVAVGTAMSAVGLAVIRRLGRLPDEPRVLAGAPR